MCSLANNNLTEYGQDMSGLLKLAEALPQTKIESLKCVSLLYLTFYPR